ncbi:MAG: leucine-rich repeat domain-containing protein [Ruminococcaceae bacterium]|nr:leucine-rich repeat domain-containing protein [Oscillospiraceae bacterium]
MKSFNKCMSFILALVMLISALSVNVFAGEDVTNVEKATEVAQREDDDITETEIAEEPSTVTEKGMQFRIENLEDVKSIRYAYGEYETEREIKYGEDAVSHSGKTLRKRGDSCTLQFTKPGLVSIVVTYNDGTRDFYKYEVIKSEPTVTRDGGNDIIFGNLTDLKVLRYAKGEYESSYDIKRAKNSVAVSGKTLDSDTYTATLDRETYTFCVQYNDESYNYYVTGVCGDNLTWVYDMQSATLTISGEGEMENYYRNSPWDEYLSEIKSVIFKSGVTTVGSFAFMGGNSITDVYFPNTLVLINYDCFRECVSLDSIIIPNSVTEIEANAFEKCTNLKSVAIGDGVSIIWESAFRYCTSLTDVKFGKNVKVIADQAFYGCISLYDIDFPRSDIDIWEWAFHNTGAFSVYDNWEDNLLYIDGYLMASDHPYLDNVYSIVIREGTTTIAAFALDLCDVSYVYIPKSVTFIGGLTNDRDTVFMVYDGSYAHEYVIAANRNYGIIDE